MRRPMEDLRGYGAAGAAVQDPELLSGRGHPAGGARRPGGGVPRAVGGLLLPGNVELTHRDATKGRAMTRPVRASGHPLERAVAFGDERNDCSMLAAGLGLVAIGGTLAPGDQGRRRGW